MKTQRLNKYFDVPHSLGLVFVIIMAASQTVMAGDGNFTSPDGINGQFNFCVVVTFHANANQLEYIRRGFQRGSDVLADATDGHHRFGAINIVNDCVNGCEAAASAEFVIYSSPSNGPQSIPGGYGVRGSFIGISIPIFERMTLDIPGGDLFLDEVGFVVAHEFAHLTYGVADEYKGPNGLNANCAPGVVDPEQPPMDDPNLNYCLMDSYNTRGGMSVVDSGSKRHTLNEFCVASNHDPDRNTFQSLAHNNMSCWETIASLEKAWQLSAPNGLPNPNPPPPPPPPASGTVTFGTVCGSQRVALLIDRSESMVNDGRLNFAKGAANLFTTFYSDSYLGIVSFANSSSVNYPLTLITNDTQRNAAKAAVTSLVAAGATNIGGGLQAALTQLTGAGDCITCAKSIILLSDGEHNTGTPPESVITALQSSGTRVEVAVIGSGISLAGETSLKTLARKTGGRYLRVLASSGSTGPAPELGTANLLGVFLRLAHDIKGNGLIKQQKDSFTSGQVKEYPVLVEQNATNSTFTLTKANQPDNFTLSLRTPSGAVIGESSGTNIEFISDVNSKTLRITAPQSGLWKVVVSAGAVTAGQVDILAFAKHDAVRLIASVEEDTVIAPAATTVHAQPMYEGMRVVGAAVSAIAIRPDRSKLPFTMFDDGNLEQNGDAAPNDGIYSARFDRYTGDGTITFEVTAENSNGRTYEGEFADPSATTPVPAFSRMGSTTVTVSGISVDGIVWFDDVMPEGATLHGDADGGASGAGEGDGWYWVKANPAPLSGTLAHQSTRRTGFHQHYFEGATPLALSTGDLLFTYVFLDTNNLPDEIMLQWNDGINWEHRAYWGKNKIGFGADGPDSRRYIGPLPAAGRWVRLEVPASLVGLEGRSVTGMAFSLYGGRATWDHSGRLLPVPPAPGPYPNDFVWVEDAVPAGAIQEVVDDQWVWLPPHFSGTQGHRSFLADHPRDVGKFRAHSFRNATTTMKVERGDVLFTYVYLDGSDNGAKMPEEIVLQWYDGSSWEHRAYWGLNYLSSGTLGTETNRFMGGIPIGELWVRLEVPASYVGLEGKTVSGMSFGFYDTSDYAGLNWDYAGKSARAATIPLPLSATTAVWQYSNGGNSGGVVYNTSDFGGSPIKRFYAYPNQAAATVPFYRFRKADTSDPQRFYSRSSSITGWLLDDGPADKGIPFYVYPDGSTPGTVPVYLYHDTHFNYFLTTDPNEANSHPPVDSNNWAYVFAPNPPVPAAPSSLTYSSPYLLWQDNSANETGFRIEGFDITRGRWTQVNTVDANVPGYKIGYFTGRNRVRAYNIFGNSGPSNEVQGGFVWNSPPVAMMSSPADGAEVGRDVTINANVFDAEGIGTIAKVEFFADGNKLAEVTTPPYSFIWTGAPLGSHVLTVKVTDEAGASATSSPINISVSANPPIFSDNFNDNSLDAIKWTVMYPQGTPPVTEQAQQLQITLAPNTAGYNGVYSNSTFDLTGRMAQVEVAQPVSQAGWVENYFKLMLDEQNYFLISAGATSIGFRSMVNGVKDQTVLTFDPNSHRHWRFRHDQNLNTMNLETSSDSVVWTTRKTVTPGFALSSLQVYLVAGASGTGNGSPGAAKYDNFKLLASINPPIFSDDFNDNLLDTAKWSVIAPSSPAVVSETGQRLQITLPANTAAYNGISSKSTYDLTGKIVQVEVAQTVSQAGWCENFIQVMLDANNYYLIDVGAGSLVFRSMVGGVNNQTVIAYDPSAFPYWRIRHDQATNTIYFETSSNGTAWTTRKTVTPGFSLTALRFYLYAGAWGTGNGSPGAAKYDNFKLLGGP